MLLVVPLKSRKVFGLFLGVTLLQVFALLLMETLSIFPTKLASLGTLLLGSPKIFFLQLSWTLSFTVMEEKLQALVTLPSLLFLIFTAYYLKLSLLQHKHQQHKHRQHKYQQHNFQQHKHQQQIILQHCYHQQTILQR